MTVMENKKPGISPEKLRSLIADLNCDDMARCQNARQFLVDMGPEAIDSLS